MEPPLPLPLTACSLKSSRLKTRVLIIFFSMVLFTAILGLLQLKYLKPKDFYSFEVMDPKGRTVSLEKYRGKASLVVNVASYCQHTEKNYIMLQELHREFGPYHFTVLAFPCNQYGEMEPDTSRRIEYLAKSNYRVTFPIFKKIKILGSEASPAFQFLIDSSKAMPRWNFWKYLINPDGKVVKFWGPEEPIESIKPDIAALVRQIILKRREDL
ncbi:putative glutathione peroxidase 8 [Podarcis muralis]|uniref:Glutathione peroxidase n=1 Tax=Podarcis muralis TaxID=64176 RepID=A0A670JTZ4_PODMU|nr:probable glutathione peroxidase 8-B [Podarcis muralis]XP_028604893.1 probable glutathione peroxidase 8 [Podarcis muralis]